MGDMATKHEGVMIVGPTETLNARIFNNSERVELHANAHALHYVALFELSTLLLL